jgi:NAD(P)-dependent dehydrogenase (short-subunit alcohol dehydrogenase family)
VLAVEGDISQPATADRITGDALARFGRIDTLVNNAGVFVSKPFTDYTAAALTRASLTRWAALTAEPAKIIQPALAASGHRDIMAPTINSYILAQHIPDGQLITYPDSGHGFLFQYTSLFVAHVARFLDTDAAFA